MDRTIKIGEKIRGLRESRKLSIEEVAERSSLSVEQVKAIEESDTLPSLAPLMKIARVLGVRLGTFLDDNQELGPVVCRSNEREESISFSNNDPKRSKHMEYFSLSKSKANRQMDPFIIDIFPSDNSDIVCSSHEGEEFIYVIEGQLEVNYGKETFVLNPGDSIYYDSIVAHHVHGADNQSAKILAVVYSPM